MYLRKRKKSCVLVSAPVRIAIYSILTCVKKTFIYEFQKGSKKLLCNDRKRRSCNIKIFRKTNPCKNQHYIENVLTLQRGQQ